MLVRSLPIHGATTPAMLWGPVVEVLFTLSGVISVIAAVFLNYRRRRAGAEVATEPSRETVTAGKAEG